MQQKFGFSTNLHFPFLREYLLELKKQVLPSLPGEHLVSAATFHPRVHILHVMRAYRFSIVFPRLGSFSGFFSHGSHFSLHVCKILYCSFEQPRHSGGVRAKFCSRPPARPGVEKSSVLFDDEVCNPRCYATQMLPWLHLCLFRYAPADETLKSLRPSVKRSKGCASACNFICNIYLDSPHICIFPFCGNICWNVAEEIRHLSNTIGKSLCE